MLGIINWLGGKALLISKLNLNAKETNIDCIRNLKVLTGGLNKAQNLAGLIEEYDLRVFNINNRRYLGNKYSLRGFIKEIVECHCPNINVVADVFSGTGAVADLFKNKMIITNDLLYSNYICNYAWFFPEKYSKYKIMEYLYEFNKVVTSENNYMRRNFADTFFSADNCSKIGYIREKIERGYRQRNVNFKEYALLITSLLYGMDRIANTVGHYDAYRKGVRLDEELIIPLLLPTYELNENNQCYNKDANELIASIECDLLYLDPPYNSRQYGSTYHLLENVATWQQPPVFGVARKMNCGHLKSDYCLKNAAQALADLIKKAKAKYILLSYNNMGNKGNGRSNAKISDQDIFNILESKGKVTIFEREYKCYSAGKSEIKNNCERLFLCEVRNANKTKQNLACPFNYTGGKYKLLSQIKPLLSKGSCFLDLFAGGCNVGINSEFSKIIFNDINWQLIGMLNFFKKAETGAIFGEIDNIIENYGLSRTDVYGYEYYECNSSKGLANYNKQKYLKLRRDYNKKAKVGINDYIMLYVLIVFSFNNQIRFNSKGEFNLPVGKRDFNTRMRKKLKLFIKALKKKDIHFQTKDFREVSLTELPTDTLIYCDPPYLITNASYNESGLWNKKDEVELLEFLKRADEKNFKFALSNVLSSKNIENKILMDWIVENNFSVNKLSRNYSNSNYQRMFKNVPSKEVLITNY